MPLLESDCWLARSLEAVNVNGYTIEPFANLEGADLNRADLDEAFLEGAKLIEATVDEKTAWPDGFDPKAAGVTFED